MGDCKLIYILEIPVQSLIKPFSSRFLQHLRQCCSEMILFHTTIPLVSSQLFYTSGDSTVRFEQLASVFAKFPFLIEGLLPLCISNTYYYAGILTNFRNTWTSSFLYSVLISECESLQQGQTTNSLLHRMHLAIKFTLFPLATQVVTTMCSNYALEAIMEIKPGDEDKKELLKLVINTISPPPMADIVNNNLNTVTTIKCQYRAPSNTVLFDVISERLLCLLRVSFSTSNVPQQLEPTFKMLVAQDPINAAVNFINLHPSLFLSFKCDFINRTLQLPLLEGKWLGLAVAFLDTFNPAGILDLYLLLHGRGNLLSSLGVMLHPLLKLKDPSPIIKGLRNDFTQMKFKPEETGKIKASILENSILTLYKYLDACTGTTNNDVENWVEVFQQFHVQNPYHNRLIEVLTPYCLHLLDIMTIVFFYFKAAEYHSLKQIHELIATTSIPEDTKQNSYIGFHHFVPLITELFSLVQYVLYNKGRKEY